MKSSSLFLAFFLFAVTSVLGTPWGVEGTPAVVNPALRSLEQKFISLSGEWDFLPGVPRFRLSKGDGVWGSHFSFEGSRKIHVPGAWEAQGVGEPGPAKTWFCNWDCAENDLRNVFMGSAVYRKVFMIPKEWAGKQIFLKIGGVRTDAYLWVNAQRAGYVNNYCETLKFNITPFLKPGEENELCAMVRNDLPSRKGLLAVLHAFGGFYRDVELEAVGPEFLDDVYVRGDFQNRAAVVNFRVVDLASEQKAPTAKLTVSAEIRTMERDAAGKLVPGPIVARGEQIVQGPAEGAFSVPLPDCRFWSPETPSLYAAFVTLRGADGAVLHGWAERFGVRELKVVGKRFFLNGKPYFLRGSGDHHYDFINLVEPPDRERFLQHLMLARAAGFNYMRHHTHCPLPEYFEAADEAGILLQPELPYYHDVQTEGAEFDPLRDLQESWRTNRRYVSFAVYSMGNEGHLGAPLDREIYEWVKRNDPDRLVLHQDGGRSTEENSDFCAPNGAGQRASSIRPWPIGTFDYLEMPFIAHEFLNLSTKVDPELETRFTGAVRMDPLKEARRQKLEAAGLAEEWGPRCVFAAQKLQAIYQKTGLEAARLDPECDGYSFWSITDCTLRQGDARTAQGLFTTFWERHPGGWELEEFRRFNGPTVLLAQTHPESAVLTSGQTLQADFSISHFDAQEIPAGRLNWQFADAHGTVEIAAIPAGTAGKIGAAEIVIPDVQKPLETELVVSIDGTKIGNRWKFWIFPKREKTSLAQCRVSPKLFPWFQERFTDVQAWTPGENAPETVLILSGDETEILAEAKAQGRKMLVLAPMSDQPDVRLGWWSLGTQVGTAFEAEHPAFGDFPLRPWMNELWFRMIRKGAKTLNAETLEFMKDAVPLAVGEGGSAWSLYLAESMDHRVVWVFAIDLLQDHPEALSLLENLVNYLR